MIKKDRGECSVLVGRLSTNRMLVFISRMREIDIFRAMKKNMYIGTPKGGAPIQSVQFALEINIIFRPKECKWKV